MRIVDATFRQDHARKIPVVGTATILAVMAMAGGRQAMAREEKCGLRFEVAVAENLAGQVNPGRLLVAIARPGGMRAGEPRFTEGDTGMDAAIWLGRDLDKLDPGGKAVVDATAEIFPIARLAALPKGRYIVQAVLRKNPDWSSPNAFGNLHSLPKQVELDPAKEMAVPLELARQIPPEKMPTDTGNVKFVRLASPALSKFHGRPVFVRAGVVLPHGFAEEPNRRYPLRVHIGGFGTRYTMARFLGGATNAEQPRFVTLVLDGASPLGDPYQVNSANHGPYGDALVNELIPYVEKEYRCGGHGGARFTDGTSTGGWVSLALQIFYPDFFNGCWSSAPDSVDFRAFELVNIYRDANVYVNRFGFERPSKRTTSGDTAFTLRHECQVENVLGFGNVWTTSGRDWGSWNATYGPRGADGRPVPLWDAKSGVIDRKVAEHYRKYDLRLILQTNWKQLAPKLQGKIHVWCGDADEYFLNVAVRLLAQAVREFDPPFEGSVTLAPGRGHQAGWSGSEVLEQMQKRYEAAKSTH